MITTISKFSLLGIIATHAIVTTAIGEVLPLSSSAKIVASSVRDGFPASHVTDGKVSDASRWLSQPSDTPHLLTFTFPDRHEFAGIHLYSGFGAGDAIVDFHVEFLSNDQWVKVPSCQITGNTSTALRLPFDDTLKVEGNSLRLVISKSKGNIARIKEVVIWPAGADNLPQLKHKVKAAPTPSHDAAEANIAPIYLNQAGFNHAAPKRFTAPTLNDGTPFQILSAEGKDIVYKGTITNHRGDFTDFNPTEKRDWVLVAGGHPSVPFTVATHHFEKITYQLALDFMIDSRHHVGDSRKPARGSYSWRDDHHFGWTLSTLVPMWLSNPSAWQNLPSQVRYEKSDDRNLWGALAPYSKDAPDLVKLIHWGADVIVTKKLEHELLKSELAYFLYAWPWMKQWLPEQNRAAVMAYVNEVWDQPTVSRKYPYDESPADGHNLLALKQKVGSTKGAYPPGFSVEPNLLMHEVCQRAGNPNAERYFQAAFRQVEWMVKHLDWEDPQVTKGQRMSEHRTIPGMAMFLRMHPERAPVGLRDKIKDWARVMVRRSDNMWDFRKLTDEGDWTPSGPKRTQWNEVGNVVGFPACAIAAASVLDQDTNLSKRLGQLVWSHFDNCFGRNPTGRHFSYDAPREIEGVEWGWYSYHKGGIGQLAKSRFVLDGAPKRQHYPYHPEVGNVGWSEGWIQFNTAFNLSLAYLAQHTTKILVTPHGEQLKIQIEGALNLNPKQRERVTVKIEVDGRVQPCVTIEESSPDSGKFTKLIKRPQGDTLKVIYGHGFLRSSTTFRLGSAKATH